MRRALSLTSFLFILASCAMPESGPSELATEYLLVTFEETGSPESCYFKQTGTIAKTTGLYMFEYDRYASGKSKFFSQEKFTSHDQIDYLRAESESGVLEGAPCSSYAITWRNLSCKSEMRGPMDCPEVRFAGTDIFASVKIED